MKDLSKKKKEDPYKVTTTEKAVKDVDLSERIVSGIFNSYFYIDSDMDMLLPGCAAKSIQERGAGSTKGNKIKHLKDHDWSKNIARIDVLDEREIEIDGRKMQGIYHESFYPESTDSTDQLIKIQEGLYDARSIGFRYINLEYVEEGMEDFDKFLAMAVNPEKGEEAGYFYVVKEIQLWEGSDVSFGANQLTPTLGVKGLNKQLLQSKLNDKLDICKTMFKSGNISDEGFHRLDMEMKQIKSYIATLTEWQTPKPNTPKQTGGRQGQEGTSTGFDFLKHLK